MEIIWTGVLLALGFYFAPFVLAFCLGAIALVFGGIASLFGGSK